MVTGFIRPQGALPFTETGRNGAHCQVVGARMRKPERIGCPVVVVLSPYRYGFWIVGRLLITHKSVVCKCGRFERCPRDCEIEHSSDASPDHFGAGRGIVATA